MSYNVNSHQVLRIAIPHSEKELVKTCIECTNSFVHDNYSADDNAAYIAVNASGEAIIPHRIEIIGNLLVYIRLANKVEDVAGFIYNLREELSKIGLKLSDCDGKMIR